MSFKEKSAWVTLAVIVLVYGQYFSSVLRGAAGGAPDVVAVREELIPTILGLIVLLIVAHVATAILTAITGGSAMEDERDKQIALHGERNGGAAVGLSAVTAIGALLFAETPPVEVVHILLAGLVAGEAINQISRIVLYRKGV